MRALAFSLLLLIPAPAVAQTADETAVRAVIDVWYADLQKPGGHNDLYRLHAPGFIDGGPAETQLRPQSAARSPTSSNELAATALKFSYEIDALKVEPTLAKAVVWERGLFLRLVRQGDLRDRRSRHLRAGEAGRWPLADPRPRRQLRGRPAQQGHEVLPDMKPVWDKLHPNGQP